MLAEMKKNITQTAQETLEDNSHPTVKALPAKSAQIRIPSQRPVPPINSKKKHETHQVTKEWNDEVSHTDRVSLYLASTLKTGKDLAPKRIQRLSLKTSKILKKIAELQELPQRKHKVSKTTEVNEALKKQQDSDELWRDMIKPHEERNFQIDRIANFFS